MIEIKRRRRFMRQIGCMNGGDSFFVGRVLLAALAALATAGCGGGGDSSVPVASFGGVGTLPGFAGSRAMAVSADGQMVAATAGSPSAGPQQAFRRSASGGLMALGWLTAGTRSEAAGISADGTAVVGGADVGGEGGTVSAAFRWTAAGGMERIPPAEGSTLCAATAVSGDGLIVTGTCLAANNVAFRWTAGGGTVRLGQYGGGMGAASTATAISRDGRVIGGAGNPFVTGAMLWPAGADPVFIGKLDPTHQYASVNALSRDGSVAAGLSVDSQGVAWMFRWRAATGMQRIGSGGAVPLGMSGDGSVLVGFSVEAGRETAVIWDDVRGLRPLAQALALEWGAPATGWTLQRAHAISDDGRVIAGTGVNPQGVTEGWVVHMP